LTLNTLYVRLKKYAAENRVALDGHEGQATYLDLIENIEIYREKLRSSYSDCHSIILYGDFNKKSIAFLWASFLENRIVALITTSSIPEQEIVAIVDADLSFSGNSEEYHRFENKLQKKVIITEHIKKKKPGIILLSSGTTGKPKAVFHDAEKLLKKYLSSRKNYATIALMLFDHIAGFDTMQYVLASGGRLVIPDTISADSVINTTIKYSVEVLPASPSLIQLLLMDNRFCAEDIPTLKIITFGSERISDDVLTRLVERFGDKVKLIQKYGITELGNPATITKPDDPRFIKFRPGIIEYKIENDTLHIKSDSSMIGYLFADSFERFDGWYDTEDKVEIDGEWMRILGRTSDIINVGGQKVYPAEVENVIHEMDGVNDVIVYGKENPIMGLIVAAKLSISTSETNLQLKKRIREHCRGKLEPYKIPAHIEIVDEIEMSKRFKRVRT